MNEASVTKKIEKDIKYLVIDDEIAANQQYRQGFIDDIAILNASALFSANCTEALTMIQQNSDILFCFLDCKLPKTESGSLNYSPQNGIDAGIELIPEISQIEQDFPIIVFSGYVDKALLRKKANKYSSNIIDCLNKDDSSKGYREAAIKALNFRKIFIENRSDQKDVLINNKFSQNSLFDYEQLTPETQSMLREKAEKIKKLLRRSGRDIYDIGKYLTEVKQSLQHGQFYSWLQAELKWSSTSAVRFMKVYEKFKSFNLDDLNIVPSALYELSNNAIPNEVLLETIELADKGETVTVELARSIKEKYKKKRKEEDASSNSSKIKSDNSTGNSTSTIPSSSGLKSNNDLSSVAESDVSRARNTSKGGSLQALPLRREASLLNRDKAGVIPVKHDIVKVISPQRIWQLGKREQHIIMCQDPNSNKFIEQLPSNIALCLAFPSSQGWQFEYDGCESMMTFYSKYQNLDEVALLDSIQHTIEFTTQEKDVIAVCFMPSLRIISLINDLGCRAMIAEPDRDKCLALVEKSSNIN